MKQPVQNTNPQIIAILTAKQLHKTFSKLISEINDLYLGKKTLSDESLLKIVDLIKNKTLSEDQAFNKALDAFLYEMNFRVVNPTVISVKNSKKDSAQKTPPSYTEVVAKLSQHYGEMLTCLLEKEQAFKQQVFTAVADFEKKIFKELEKSINIEENCQKILVGIIVVTTLLANNLDKGKKMSERDDNAYVILLKMRSDVALCRILGQKAPQPVAQTTAQNTNHIDHNSTFFSSTTLSSKAPGSSAPSSTHPKTNVNPRHQWRDPSADEIKENGIPDINSLMLELHQLKQTVSSLQQQLGRKNQNNAQASSPQFDENLLALQRAVCNAQKDYKDWYEHQCGISFFHHHGKAGQERAVELNELIADYKDLTPSLTGLSTHLARKKSTFHEHSFDRFLIYHILVQSLTNKKCNLEELFQLQDVNATIRQKNEINIEDCTVALNAIKGQLDELTIEGENESLNFQYRYPKK